MDSQERLKDISPAVNFILNPCLKNMKENDKKIDQVLALVKQNVNLKIKNICKSFEYLERKKLVKFEDLNEEEFSLYNFKFQNIKNEDKPIVNDFIECVTDISLKENTLIEEMNIRQEEINNSITLCKSTCVFEKIKIKEIEDNEIMTCLTNCINKINTNHAEYTKDYLKRLDNITKMFNNFI